MVDKFAKDILKQTQTKNIIVALLLLTVLGCTGYMIVRATTASATSYKVVAYYFHGAIRCQACLEIEAVSRQTVEQEFTKAIAEKRLAWRSVDYDEAGNEHFVEEYELSCPSLVIVEMRDGKRSEWKILRRTWELLRNKNDLRKYVHNEVKTYLGKGR